MNLTIPIHLISSIFKVILSSAVLFVCTHKEDSIFHKYRNIHLKKKRNIILSWIFLNKYHGIIKALCKRVYQVKMFQGERFSLRIFFFFFALLLMETLSRPFVRPSFRKLFTFSSFQESLGKLQPHLAQRIL